MIKLLGIISIILAIVLFPPAALAVISNNAVPGDATYPVKRSLEGGIYAVASLNPLIKAWFSAARSDRRFTEVKSLVINGKSARFTLKELVAQTDTAVEEIDKVTNLVKKKELLESYEQTIGKYQVELIELKEKASNTRPLPTTQPTSTAQPSPFQPVSISEPTSTITSKPSARPSPTTTSTPYIPPETTTFTPENHELTLEEYQAIPRISVGNTVSPTEPPKPAEDPKVITLPTDMENDLGDTIDDLDKIKNKIRDKKEKEHFDKQIQQEDERKTDRGIQNSKGKNQ